MIQGCGGGLQSSPPACRRSQATVPNGRVATLEQRFPPDLWVAPGLVGSARGGGDGHQSADEWRARLVMMPGSPRCGTLHPGGRVILFGASPQRTASAPSIPSETVRERPACVRLVSVSRRRPHTLQPHHQTGVWNIPHRKSTAVGVWKGQSRQGASSTRDTAATEPPPPTTVCTPPPQRLHRNVQHRARVRKGSVAGRGHPARGPHRGRVPQRPAGLPLAGTPWRAGHA